MYFITCVFLFAATLTMYLRSVYSRFSKYGVNALKPVPFLGNVADVAFRKKHIGDNMDILYKAFPNDRFVGRFEMMTPIVMIRDLELIKQVVIKDFEYFIDHRKFVDETVDPLFGRNIFSLKGQEWKDMRATLSPAFTSSKIRAMVPFMVDVNKQMMRFLKEKLDHSRCGYIDIDAKDLTTRYTNDVIASCGFGFKVDSHADLQNEFYLAAKTTAHFDFRRILVYLGYSIFPSLMKKLNIKFLSEKANGFFKDLFLNTMLERKVKKIYRPDMIHLLMEAKRGNLKHESPDQNDDAGYANAKESDIGKQTVKRAWSDTDLIAQMLILFFAGFESVSSAMCFLLYELAVNPQVQDRMVEEFRKNEQKGEELSFDDIVSLQYLDMVVSELLRLWPIAVGLDRVCTKSYNLGRPNDAAKEDYIIHQGEFILIPAWPLHRDPNFYPEPEKFDPERFSEENKANIKPYTYMPFGLGPRNCIGSRLALCEVKVMIYHLLLQFEVSPAKNTRIPAELVSNSFTLSMKGGHWIRFRARV